MSDRDGRDLTALRRLAVGLLFLVGAGFFFAGTEAVLGIGARRHQETAQEAHRDCAKLGDCSAESLNANIRSAHANEDMVDVAVWQLALGFVGLMGVGLTVYYAHRAWEEAKRSADAAHDTLADARADSAAQVERFRQQMEIATKAAQASAKLATVAEDTASKQLRAYVHAESISLNWSADHPVFRIHMKNSGQTPATAVKAGGVYMFGDTKQLAAINDVQPGILLGGNAVVGASSPYVTSLLVHGYQDIRREHFLPGQMLAVFGRIHYSDVFGVRYETEFAFFVTSAVLDTMTDLSGYNHRMFKALPEGAK